MNGCCAACRHDRDITTFPGVLAPAAAARIVAGHPGLAVSLGGLVARVIWAEADEQAADGVAELAGARLGFGDDAA